MAVTQVGYGVLHSVFNAANQPTPPTGIQPGDMYIYITGEFIGTDTLTTPAGWTLLSPASAAKQTAIYALTAVTGSETMPSVSWGNQFSFTQVGVYRGLDPAITVLAASDRSSNQTQNIIGPAGTITPSQDGALVLFIGNKNKTTTSNGTVFSAPTNFSVVSQTVPNGARSCTVICEWIQTTATAIPANQAISGSIADGAVQSTQGVMVVLAAAAGPPPVTVTNVGFVPQPGSPNLQSPRNNLQFDGASGISLPAAIPAPVSGILASSSVVYGNISRFAPLSLGFVPQPGPGIGPFSNNQFETFTWATSNPSPTTTNLSGTVYSGSVLYLATGSVAGSLAGQIPVSSVVYGSIQGLLAGSMTGILASSSVTYSGVGGILDLSFALSQSNSTITMLQAGSGNFQPLVPFTAVVDVRLNIGYQPWRVHPEGTIG